MSKAARIRRQREQQAGGDGLPDLSDVTAAPPLRLSVATFPGLYDDGSFLANDLELVKASVLYADEIDLWSAGAALMYTIEGIRKGGLKSLVELIEAMSPQVRRRFKLPDLPPGMVEHAPALERADDWTEVLAMFATEPEELAALEQIRNHMAGYSSGIAPIYDQLAESLDASGMDALWPAVRRRNGQDGIVRPRFLSAAGDEGWDLADLSPVLEQPPNLNALIGRWILTMQRLLDEGGALLLDKQVGASVRELLDKGFLPSAGTIPASRAAKLGSHLLIELPAFPWAPLDELLDVRDEHAESLRRYRIAVAALAADNLTGQPFSTEWDDQVRTVMDEHVRPALVRIQDELTDSSFTKEFARTLKTESRFLVIGGASLIGMFTGSTMFGTAVASAATAVGAAAGPVIASAFAARTNIADRNQRVDRDGLSYLLKTNQSIYDRLAAGSARAVIPVSPDPSARPTSATPPPLEGAAAEQLLADLGTINPHLNHRRSITRARNTMDDIRRGRPEPVIISNVQHRYSNGDTVQLNLDQAAQILMIIRAAYAAHHPEPPESEPSSPPDQAS